MRLIVQRLNHLPYHINSFIRFNHIRRISKHSPTKDSGSIVLFTVCRKSLPGLMPSKPPSPTFHFHSKHQRRPRKVEAPFPRIMEFVFPLRFKPIDAAMQFKGTFPYRWRSGDAGGLCSAFNWHLYPRCVPAYGIHGIGYARYQVCPNLQHRETSNVPYRT